MIKCKGYKERDTWRGPGEWCCGWDTDIDCGECIINGGNMSPVSGKPFRGNPEPYHEECRKRYGEKFFDDPGEEYEWLHFDIRD